jgi:hypothetical protein
VTSHWASFMSSPPPRKTNKLTFWVCPCSLTYLEYMLHTMLPCVACLAEPYFSTLSHERHDFRKKGFWTQNVCFHFLATFVWSISHSKKNWTRYYHKWALVFMWSNRYNSHILMKLEFYRRILEKYPNVKLYVNPQCDPSCSMWTDRQTWWI